MQSWLNWYSIGLENRHSERISGFESLALRYAYVVKRLRQRTATPQSLVRFQPYAYGKSVLFGVSRKGGSYDDSNHRHGKNRSKY